MKVRDLIEAFADHDHFPIKPQDISRLLMAAGIEEEIIFIEVDIDTSILRGFIVQTTEPRGIYDSNGNGNISKIYYGIGQSFEWQRLVCCKELLHILDDPLRRLSTQDQVTGLIKKMALPPQFQLGDDESEDGIQALFDRIGALQAVAVLFPMAVRELILPKYAEGLIADDEIVGIVGIPERYVRIVMSEFWPRIHKSVCSL